MLFQRPPTIIGFAADKSASNPNAATHAEFEAVVEKYHAKVFQLVYRYTGDYEEACDLTQDTFVRAFNAWTEFRGDSQVYTWLYRIALNLCHNQQKRLQRRHSMERWSLDAVPDDDFGDARGPVEVADERPLPLARLEGDEMRHRLREALLQLPDNYRTVIVLRDIEGLTYEEIARVTDSTLEAIKSRLFRARQNLRRVLEPYMTGGLESAPLAPTRETSTRAASAREIQRETEREAAPAWGARLPNAV